MATANIIAIDPQAEALLRSFERSLRAEGRSEATITQHLGGSRRLLRFATEQNMPSIESLSREHCELWMAYMYERYSRASVRHFYIGAKRFFGWLLEEGEIERSPMAKIPAPVLEETRKDVVSVEEVGHVLAMLDRQAKNRKAAKETRLRAERDALIIAAFFDTGLRANELAMLRMDHVNVERGEFFIEHSKNKRIRSVRLRQESLPLLDRYLRHLERASEYLFNSRTDRYGHITKSGLYQIVTARFAEAGIERVIGCHDLRHSWASDNVGTVSESELMSLGGWSDPKMVRNYSKQVLNQRAMDSL